MKTTVFFLIAAGLLISTANAGEFGRSVDKLEGTEFWYYVQVSNEDKDIALVVQHDAWGLASRKPIVLWWPDDIRKGSTKTLRYRTDAMRTPREVSAQIRKKDLFAFKDVGYVLGGSSIVVKVNYDVYTFDLDDASAQKAKAAYLNK
jgi:hypothetical protein